MVGGRRPAKGHMGKGPKENAEINYSEQNVMPYIMKMS